MTAMASDEGTAAARWRHLVSDRRDEVDRLSPGRGSLSGSFWDRRADRYAASVTTAAIEARPFLRRLRRETPANGSAIDAGAGTGSFALALAASVRHVTAVDPSDGMLAVLRRHADERGVTNVTTIKGTWEEAVVEPADVAFSSFVLTLVPDAPAFVRKLEAMARHRVLLYLGAFAGDAALDPLWRHFHGAPRAPGASYMDALAVLRELDIAAEVRVVETVDRRRFATVDDAVQHYREWLLLPETPEVAEELAGLLTTWLLGRRGAFRSPVRSSPAAIIAWRPRAQRLRS